MSSPYFRFKQFTVWHDKCAMKVGTDGVLLGAWAQSVNTPPPSSQSISILDVGCGTGLISLMLAQRYPHSHIIAIDIDYDAAQQATRNVLESPFQDRIKVIRADFLDFTSSSPATTPNTLRPAPYSLIVSNPPYFEDTPSTISTSSPRDIARHAQKLNFETLIQHSAELLSEQGTFAVIIPFDVANRFISIAASHNLYLHSRCDIRNNESKPFKRAMLAFCKDIHDTHTTSLTIRNIDNTYTLDYITLTQDFYL